MILRIELILFLFIYIFVVIIIIIFIFLGILIFIYKFIIFLLIILFRIFFWYYLVLFLSSIKNHPESECPFHTSGLEVGSLPQPFFDLDILREKEINILISKGKLPNFNKKPNLFKFIKNKFKFK